MTKAWEARPAAGAAMPGRARRALRLADRYVGIPLLAGLAAFRVKRRVPDRVARVGLLNTAAIGDTVLMGAVAADLRRAYPEATLIVFAGPSNYEAACLLEAPDAIEALGIGNPLAAVRRLRECRLDLLIDFGPWARLNALLALLGGARATVGFHTPGQCRHFGYDIAVDHRDDVHELENHRALVRALGLAARQVPSLDRMALAPAAVFPGQDFVVLHPWAGGTHARLKEWPLGRWIGLAAALADEGYRIVLTGAPTQHTLNELVASRLPERSRLEVTNAAGLSLAGTAALLGAARAVVSVDTGIGHVAAALGTPVVVLYGPTSPRRWGAIGKAAIAIESPLEGSGYISLGFERRRRAPDCMEAIDLPTVLEACHRALAAKPAAGAPREARARSADRSESLVP